MTKLRLTLLWSNCGPYHLARARALAERDGLEPTIIEVHGEDEHHPWGIATGGISVPRYTLTSGDEQRPNDTTLCELLEHTLEEINPDVLISAYHTPVMRAGVRWAKRNGRVSILSFGTTAGDRKRWWLKEWIKKRYISKNFDAAIVPGKPHQRYLNNLGFGNDYIWGPSEVVDNSYFSTKALSVRKAPGKYKKQIGVPENYFLYIGRFSEEKDLPSLLEAFQNCKNNTDNQWGLVLVGDGPQRKELEELVKRGNIRSVFFKGFAQIEELPIYYALANVFILPSSSEAWGLVVNEAMSCGLPILASDTTGCAEDLVQEGGNGFVFKPGSTTGMSELMDKMLIMNEDERQAMGKRSEDIISRYTLKAWADGLETCMKQTLLKNKV